MLLPIRHGIAGGTKTWGAALSPLLCICFAGLDKGVDKSEPLSYYVIALSYWVRGLIYYLM
jgi:hypothetical protein